MPGFGVFHDDVVGLVKDVGTITVGTVLGQIAILVDVRVDGLDSVFGVLFVESIEQFVEIAEFLGRIVFKDLDLDVTLEFAVKDGEDWGVFVRVDDFRIASGFVWLAREGWLLRASARDEDGGDGGAERDDELPFHAFTS